MGVSNEQYGQYLNQDAATGRRFVFPAGGGLEKLFFGVKDDVS